jgi:hypothetical protein
MYASKYKSIDNESGLLKKAASLSLKSYKDPWPGELDTSHWGRFVVGRYSTVADLVYDRGAVYITVRGTEPEDAGDWASNLDTGRTPIPELMGHAHRGFYQAAAGLFRELREPVLDLVVPGARPVFVTGHSRGGAIAQLLQPMLDGLGAWTGLWTFGAPPVLDARAADTAGRLFGTRAMRVQAGNDPVPRLHIDPYRHPHSRFLYLDSFGRPYPDRIPVPVRIQQATIRWANRHNWFRFSGLHEHRMEHYKKLVDAL